MSILADYHTHTKYSRNGHGKSTVEENVRVAYEKGLRQIAITDHGFNQKTFGVRRKDIPQVRADIEDAKERYPIDVLLGVEANLLDSQGHIDIIDSDYDDLDIILCGFHKLVKSTSSREQWKFVMKNIMCTLLRRFVESVRSLMPQNWNAPSLSLPSDISVTLRGITTF